MKVNAFKLIHINSLSHLPSRLKSSKSRERYVYIEREKGTSEKEKKRGGVESTYLKKVKIGVQKGRSRC